MLAYNFYKNHLLSSLKCVLDVQGHEKRSRFKKEYRETKRKLTCKEAN